MILENDQNTPRKKKMTTRTRNSKNDRNYHKPKK